MVFCVCFRYNEHYPVGLDPPYELLEKDYWDMVHYPHELTILGRQSTIL